MRQESTADIRRTILNRKKLQPCQNRLPTRLERHKGLSYENRFDNCRCLFFDCIYRRLFCQPTLQEGFGRRIHYGRTRPNLVLGCVCPVCDGCRSCHSQSVRTGISVGLLHHPVEQRAHVVHRLGCGDVYRSDLLAVTNRYHCACQA